MQSNITQAIVVLGGGFTNSGKPTTASALRTAKAVALAKLYPDAKIIFSGNQTARTILDLRKIPASSELFRPAKTNFSVVDVPSGTSPPDKIGCNSLESSSDRDEVLRKSSIQNATKITEAAIMKNYALKLGLDPRRILLEDMSCDTLANAMYSKKYLLAPLQLHNIIVVTSSVHVPRAEYIFCKILGPEYNITFVSAGGETTIKQSAKEQRALTFAKALLDTVINGDDEVVWLRVNEWQPYAKHPPFTTAQWYAYIDHGKPLPTFPNYETNRKIIV